MAVDTYALISLFKAKNYMGHEKDTGTATEDPPDDTTGILTDSNASFTADEHNARTLYITSGTADGNTYTIDDTGTTTLTCTGDNLYDDGVRSGDSYQVFKDTTNNTFIENLINRASDMIETYCGRKFLSRDYSPEKLNGTGRKSILLKHYPITAVSAISVGTIDALSITNTSTNTTAFVRVDSTGIVLTKDGTEDSTVLFATYATLSTVATAINAIGNWSATVPDSTYNDYKSTQILVSYNQYCLNLDYAYPQMPSPNGYVSNFGYNADIGELYLPSNTGCGRQSIYVWYTAGFSTAPDDIENACCMQVDWMYKQSGYGHSLLGINRRQFDDGSMTYTGKAILPSIQITLDSYKRVLV